MNQPNSIPAVLLRGEFRIDAWIVNYSYEIVLENLLRKVNGKI